MNLLEQKEEEAKKTFLKNFKEINKKLKKINPLFVLVENEYRNCLKNNFDFNKILELKKKRYVDMMYNNEKELFIKEFNQFSKYISLSIEKDFLYYCGFGSKLDLIKLNLDLQRFTAKKNNKDFSDYNDYSIKELFNLYCSDLNNFNEVEFCFKNNRKYQSLIDNAKQKHLNNFIDIIENMI